MALLFSAVTVTAGEDEIELLVGGIPREYDDLEGWSEFDDLMCFISEETEVSVRAEAYLYGEGESMRASPEEIDDLMQRMKDDTGFLNLFTEKTGTAVENWKFGCVHLYQAVIYFVGI